MQGGGFICSHTGKMICSRHLYWIHLLILMRNQRGSLIFYKGININEKTYLIKGDIKNLSDVEKVFEIEYSFILHK